MRRVTIVITLAILGFASTGDAQTIKVDSDAFGVPAGERVDATSYTLDLETPPPAPTRLSVTSSGGGVSLSWTAADGADSYNIKRGTSAGTETLVATDVASASYIDSAVDFGPRYFYVVSAVNGSGESPDSNEASISLKVTPPGDLDGDGKTDIMIYRPYIAALWALKSGGNFSTYGIYGWTTAQGNAVEPGDYDGDGILDWVNYIPSNGLWWVWPSSMDYRAGSAYAWGAYGDVPVPADYDGDGKTDIAVFRPSTGGWWILESSTGFASYVTYGWGMTGDVPVLGDYDGDGKTDIAVFRPTTGGWWILKSSTNFTTYMTYGWGATGDIPLFHRP